MRAFEIIVVVAVAALAAASSGQTPLSGNLSGTLAADVYHVTSDVDVALGDTLVLDPGVIIKFSSNRRLRVWGTLTSNGTAANPVVFTSLADDASGGDTNGDGPSSGAAGDWNGLRFEDASDASVLTHSLVRFAGGNILQGAVELFDADITMIDCVVEIADHNGIDFNGGSFPTIRRCAIDQARLPMKNVPLGALPGLVANTAAGNTEGDFAEVDATAVDGDVTVFPHNYPGEAVVFETGLSLVPGAVVTFERGCVIKMKSTLATFQSSLGAVNFHGTGLEPVIVTSFEDDSIAGDTNNDGNATAPAPGQWSGVWYKPDTLGATVRHLTLRYGGYLRPGFRSESPLVSIDSVRAEYCTRSGIRLDAALGDVTNCVSFANDRHGFDLGDGGVDLVHATSVGNAWDGIHGLGAYTGTITNSIAWGNLQDQIDAAVPVGQVSFTVADAAFAGSAGNISQDPLLVDQANGDLGLQAASPCVNTALLAAVPSVVTDGSGASRVLDHDLSGVILPDMGAYERGLYDLAFMGRPQTGTGMVFTVVGAGAPSDIVILVASVGTGHELIDTYGFLTIGVQSTVFLVTTTFLNQPMPIAIPDLPVLDGFPFNLQALAVKATDTTKGNFTPAYRGIVFDT